MRLLLFHAPLSAFLFAGLGEDLKGGFIQKLAPIGLQFEEIIVQWAGVASAAPAWSEGAGVFLHFALKQADNIRQSNFSRWARQAIATAGTGDSPAQASRRRFAQQFRRKRWRNFPFAPDFR